MNETVYKVVRYTDKEGVYVSGVVESRNPLCVEYVVGKVSFPPQFISKSKLFAFRKIDDAISFATNIILPSDSIRYIFGSKACNVESITKVAHVDKNMYLLDNVKRFWRVRHRYDCSVFTAPTGTVGCDSIELVKMVVSVECRKGEIFVDHMYLKKET